MRRLIPLIFVFIFAAGVILLINGYMEYTVGKGSGSTPQEVELSALEPGATLTNNYTIIGPHWRLYGAAVYRYTIPKSATSKDPKPEYTVDYTYYPIISDQHPFLAQLRSLAAKYGSVALIPENEMPALTDFSVLVKTFEFRTIGTLPDGIDKADKLEGLVISKIETLSSKEKELITEGFPNVDFSKIYIVEANRKPTSTSQAIAMMLGGLVLVLSPVLVGLILFLRQRSQKRLPPTSFTA